MAGTVVLIALCLCPAAWLPVSEHKAVGPKLPLDKLAHVFLFTQFTALWTLAGPRGRSGWPWRGAVVALGLVLAVGTELLQGLPGIGRDPDTFDAMADGMGCLLGFLVALPFVRGTATSPGD